MGSYKTSYIEQLSVPDSCGGNKAMYEECSVRGNAPNAFSGQWASPATGDVLLELLFAGGNIAHRFIP
jgi:hypothetical protein